MGLALSDLLLALAGLWAIWHLRSAQPPSARLFARLGVVLLTAAAALGAVRYTGHVQLADLHRQASNLGAVLGLPLMMLALAYSRLETRASGPAWPRRSLTAVLVIMVCAVGLLGERLPAAVASLGLLGVAIAAQPRLFTGPAGLIIGMLGLGAWRGYAAVDITLRLTLLHLGLALLLLLWLREMGRMPAAREGRA